MKKVILSLAVVFVMSSFTTSNTNVEEITVEKETIEEVGRASDCVQWARNIIIGYAIGTDTDYSSDGPEYDYLMSEYMNLYRGCLNG